MGKQTEKRKPGRPFLAEQDRRIRVATMIRPDELEVLRGFAASRGQTTSAAIRSCVRAVILLPDWKDKIVRK